MAVSYRDLAQKQVSLLEMLGELDSDDHLLLLENGFSSLWLRIQGLACGGGAALEVAICCSLLQLRLCLALRDGSPSHSDHAHFYLNQLTHRLRLSFNIGDGSGEDDCLLPGVLSLSDYMRRAIARVFTVASVIDLFSSSLHERSLRRLAVAHDLVSPGEHSSCRDWFECLLRTKASLSSRECCSEGELNYFNGWWGKDLVFSVSSPSAIHWPSSAMHTLYSGNCLAQRGYFHLAIGRYRQCLLQSHGFSFSTAAAIANTALLFQKVNNVDAELETRSLLLKALRYLAFHRLEDISSKCIIWRRECHVSTESGIHGDDTWLPKAVYVTTLRAVHCKRPELAVSVLEEGLDMMSLYGLVPSLLLLRSLVELGRGRDALDVCLKIIAGWRALDLTGDTKTGVQRAQVLLLGSTAALSSDQYQLAYLFAVRCSGLAASLWPQLTEASLLRQCTQCMQSSLCVRAILLVGAGRLTSALSLLTSAVGGSCDGNVVARYNLALLKVKLSHDSSTLTPQTLAALHSSLKDTQSMHGL